MAERRPIPWNIGRRRPETRTVALVALLALASFFILVRARAFLLPLAVAAVLQFPLRPFVRRLRAAGLHEGAGAAIVLGLVLAPLSAGVYQLSGPAYAWMADAPRMLQSVENKIRVLKGPVESVTKAGDSMRRLTSVHGSQGAQEVHVRRPGLGESVVKGTPEVLSGVLITIVMLYFLLASGDRFLLKVVRVMPSLEKRKRAVRLSRQVESCLSRYLVVTALINATVGAIVGTALHLIGLPNPLLFAVLVAVLKFIPYAGALVAAGIIALASFLTFDDLTRALAAPLLFLAIDTVEAYFVTPHVVGRRLMLHPLVVFTGTVFWWWIWGIAGALIAVPILVSFKLFCDEVKPLTPVGEFLAR